MNDLNLSAWVGARKEELGPHSHYIIRSVVRYEEQIADFRETNRLLHRRTQEAESTAYRNAGRCKRKIDKLTEHFSYAWRSADKRLARERVALAQVRKLKARVKDLEAQLAAAPDRVQDGE